MRTELYDAVRDATEGEFDLLGELDGGPGWMACLARARGSGALSLLVLQEAPGEEFDLEVVEALDATLAVGRTTCSECGTGMDGWPRYCEACGRDLSGVAAGGVAGASDAELLDAVRAAAEGEYKVLGAMHHGEGGGAVYFARELKTGALVGLTLEAEADGDLALSSSWAAGGVAQNEIEGAAPVPVPVSSEPVPVSPLAPPVLEPAPVYVPPVGVPDPPRRRKARGGRRTALLAGAGVLGVGAVAVLAYIIMHQPDSPAVNPDPRPEAKNEFQPPAPAPGPAPSPMDPVPPAPAPFGGDVPPPPRPAPVEESTPPLPRPSPPPPVVIAPPPPPPVDDAGATDAERIEAVIGRYAAAVQSRQMPRIRTAYPGITAAEAARWEEVLIGVGTGNTLRVTYVLDDEPTVRGDEARVPFTMVLEYRGTRQLQPLRAVLRRAGGEWRLDEVRLIG